MKKLLLFICCFILLGGSLAHAQNFVKNLKKSDKDPTDFNADSVVYDDKNKKIIAIGNVEAVHEGAILLADRLEYDMVKDVIIAKDNVTVSYSDGKTVFSDRMEVTSDFKAGIADNIIIKNSDGSYFTAKDLKAAVDAEMVMHSASYTPCDMCEGKDPSWELNASKVTYDQQGESVSYQNAYFNLFGVPIMYLPYFSHGDMKKDSKTGFLTPKFGTSKKLGAMFSLPLFIHITDNHKVTLTPTYLSKENPLFSGDYHGYTSHSKIDFRGSYVQQKDDDERYFFNIKTATHLTENWRLRTDLYSISDDTFLKVYDLPNKDDPWFMDTVGLDGFWRNSNLNISYYYFKDLRSNVDNKTMPTVFPAVDFNYYSDPNKFGGFYNFKFNSALIKRDKLYKHRDERYQRYTAMFDYNLPLKGKFGDMYKITTSLRGDIYNLDNTTSSDATLYSGTKSRFYPELSFTASYPLVRTDKKFTQIIEPKMVLAVAPNLKEIKEIPNEDSRDFELTESNILATNRFSGYDKVETGNRMNFGVNWNLYAHDGYSLTTFMGQSYRLTDTDYFPTNSGMGKGFSDYIGAVNFSGSPFFNMDYSFRLNKDDLRIKRSELSMGLGNTFLKANLSYLFIKANYQDGADYKDREELKLGLTSSLTRYIKAAFGTKYNMYTDKTVETVFKIGYEDECLGLYFNFKRDFTQDRDYKGDTTVMITLNLKTIGTLRTGSLAVQ